MRYEELYEGKNNPSIVVDVQPAYENGIYFDISEMMQFLNNQRGPILIYVNADEHFPDSDTKWEIYEWYEEHGFNPTNWDRVTYLDKGYGYFRSWMDYGISEANIIKTIRLMYQKGVNDSRELFGGDSEEYVESMQQWLGDDFDKNVLDDQLNVGWVSIETLRQFSGGYIMGGGREECLKEVQLYMSAFNVKAKEIQEFIY